MFSTKSGRITLICQFLIRLLICDISNGFQTYVTQNTWGRGCISSCSSQSNMKWRLNEKKIDVSHNIIDEKKVTIQMDDLISTTKQHHHNDNLHTEHHANAHHDHKPAFSIVNSISSPHHGNDSNSLSSTSSPSYFIPEDKINTILTFGSGEKRKIVNEFGLWCLTMCFLTLPPWGAAMSLVDAVCKLKPNLDPYMSFFDYTGKIWSRIYLRTINSYPTISGDVAWIHDENKGKACLYVANHASWIDIPIVCTVLDPVFKFIAKNDLKGVPCIGQQLVGGNHILIDRDDRRSQLRAFKEGVKYLKNGIPVMAFPEGQRSDDGRLSDFKGGIFSMAVKAKVPIVPISISNAHAVMPKYSLMPIQNGANKLSVHVHPAIDTDGLTDSELSAKVFNAIASKLPEEQRPLSKVEEVNEGVKIPINA